MNGSRIEIYNENSIPECRICLENGPGLLITPCNCYGSQKYVHLECLNRWRMENVNNERYTHCEICKREYNITNFYNAETFIYDSKPNMKCKGLIYFFLLYFLGSVMWTLDFETNFKTIDIITFGCSNNSLDFVINDIKHIEFGGIAPFYYMAFSSFFFSLIHIFFHLLVSCVVIHRKKCYFKKACPYIILYTISSLNIYISYVLYLVFNSRIIFISALWATTISNYLNFYNFINKHNKIINTMNSNIHFQTIESLVEADRNRNTEIICNFDEIQSNSEEEMV